MCVTASLQFLLYTSYNGLGTSLRDQLFIIAVRHKSLKRRSTDDLYRDVLEQEVMLRSMQLKVAKVELAIKEMQLKKLQEE